MKKSLLALFVVLLTSCSGNSKEEKEETSTQADTTSISLDKILSKTSCEDCNYFIHYVDSLGYSIDSLADVVTKKNLKKCNQEYIKCLDKFDVVSKYYERHTTNEHSEVSFNIIRLKKTSDFYDCSNRYNDKADNL